MIYQIDNVFKTNVNKAELTNGEVVYYDDEEELKDILVNFGEEEVVNKEKIEMSKEENERFEIIKEVPKITLDEVRAFVYGEKEPTGNNAWLIQQKDKEIAELKESNFTLTLGLVDIASQLAKQAGTNKE